MAESFSAPRRSERARKERNLDPDFIDSQAITFLVEDDILIVGPNMEGIKVKRHSEGYALNQCHYIGKIIDKFQHLNIEEANTPYESSCKLVENNGRDVAQIEYASAIGCLMYATHCTRPDIAYAVYKLSRYTSNPSQDHWKVIGIVFGYLKRTIQLALYYDRFPAVLKGYSDASWITGSSDSKFTTGWIFTLDGGAVCWGSKKQTCITHSTMKAEGEFYTLNEVYLWKLKGFTYMDIRSGAAPTKLVEEVGILLQIAKVGSLEEGTRHLAIELVITLSEAREHEAAWHTAENEDGDASKYGSIGESASELQDRIMSLICYKKKMKMSLRTYVCSIQFVDPAGRPRLSFMVDVNSSNLCILLDACDNVAKRFMGSDSNSEWRPVAAVEISYEPCVRRHVRSILMDCAMVSTMPTVDGRVSIDANHEFAEVEEKIKVDDVMKLIATIREAHEEVVQKALAAFNSMVVGTGSVRQRCEKHL
nr:zinc finger, CCHC-type [Tanacetum cinerariifolium]